MDLIGKDLRVDVEIRRDRGLSPRRTVAALLRRRPTEGVFLHVVDPFITETQWTREDDPRGALAIRGTVAFLLLITLAEAFNSSPVEGTFLQLAAARRWAA